DAPNGLTGRDWLTKIGGRRANAQQAIDALVSEDYARRVGDGGQGRPYIYISEKPFAREQWHEAGEARSLEDIARQGIV
ncbi:MAG TPA: hypothetical protein VFE55_15545, partial [Acidimicrobiia bacterium]|nr:hypothetical protein [Acidimicrobiia bacterium]